MSFIKEYEELKGKIDKDKKDYIDVYLSENLELSFNDLIYNVKNWISFNKWYYEKIKLQKVEILGTWETDYGDLACNAILYKNGEIVANIIESFDKFNFQYVNENKKININQELMNDVFIILVNERFEEFLKLPKISECSKLLTEVYDSVCFSDVSMCHIDEDTWNECYLDEFSNDDIQELEREIIKFNLENLVVINDGEYKIVGYGDLQTRFNDDRNFNLSKVNDNSFEV